MTRALEMEQKQIGEYSIWMLLNSLICWREEGMEVRDNRKEKVQCNGTGF